MSNDLSGQLGSAVSSFFSSAIVQLVVDSIVLYLFIVWLAAAFWAFRDMHDRSENPVMPYVAAALILLPTPFFFVLGVIVYRVIRPAERLGEVYERNLAEEALLAEVEAVRTCRGCDRRVQEEWIICPWCRTRLNRVCPNCERLVGLDWTLCAWCGKDFERPVTVDRAVPESAPGAYKADVEDQPILGRPAGGTITNSKPAIGG
jgi:RNA polymerase subunit RPABC4/transcription elongation factor Spt4